MMSKQSSKPGFENCTIVNPNSKRNNIRILNGSDFVELRAIKGEITYSEVRDAVDLIECEFDPEFEAYEVLGT